MIDKSVINRGEPKIIYLTLRQQKTIERVTRRRLRISRCDYVAGSNLQQFEPCLFDGIHQAFQGHPWIKLA